MIEIRLGNKDDIEMLQSLNDDLFIDNKTYDSDLNMNWAKGEFGRKYFTQLVAREDSLCLIVEENTIPIGYLSASSKEIDYRNSKYAEIENMVVDAAYRSKGIGKLLIEKCIEWAKLNGYQKLFVTAYIANQGAINFYRNNGFVDIDISLEKIL